MNQISLLLQNSSGELSVGIAKGDALLFDSALHTSLAGSRDITEYITVAESHSGINIAEIARVFVDIGPGALGATRTTAAFANALGYAKNIPVTGINAFDLLGFHVALETGKPVVCIRKAARPNFYVGIFSDGHLSGFSFSDTKAVQKIIEAHRDGSAFAGRFSFASETEDQDFLCPASVANAASMRSFLMVALKCDTSGPGNRPVFPITENLKTRHG